MRAWTLAILAPALALGGGVAQADQPFPTLADALARARTVRASAVAARGAVRAAEATRLGAELSSLGNPYLEVFADRATSGLNRDLAVQSNLWLPVDVSGQRRRRLDQVGRQVEWRSAEGERTAVDNGADLVRRYGLAVVAAERVRFLERIVGISEEEEALYQARLNARDATVRDAKLAAVDLARNRVALELARADQESGLADLAVAIGAGPLSVPAAEQLPPRSLWDLARDHGDELVERSPALKALNAEASYFAAVQAREAVEGHAPLNLIVSAGRAVDGAARIGGGLAWTFPLLRRNQGERARAAEERGRALDVAAARRRELLATLRGLIAESTHVRRGLEELRLHGESAAQAAVDAAQAIERAGKGELLHVVTARRDLVSVLASALDLEAREWFLLARLMEVTGRDP